MEQTLALKAEDAHEHADLVPPACLVWTLTDAVRDALRKTHQALKAASYRQIVLDAEFFAPYRCDDALLERIETDESIEVPASTFAAADCACIDSQRMVVTGTTVALYGDEHFSGHRIESPAIAIEDLIGDAAATSHSPNRTPPGPRSRRNCARP